MDSTLTREYSTVYISLSAQLNSCRNDLRFYSTRIKQCFPAIRRATFGVESHTHTHTHSPAANQGFGTFWFLSHVPNFRILICFTCGTFICHLFRLRFGTELLYITCSVICPETKLIHLYRRGYNWKLILVCLIFFEFFFLNFGADLNPRNLPSGTALCSDLRLGMRFRNNDVTNFCFFMLRSLVQNEGYSKKWIIEEDMRVCGANKNLTENRKRRRERIRVIDLRCVEWRRRRRRRINSIVF